MFIADFLCLVLILGFYVICGYGAITPFQNDIRVRLPVAMLTGVLLLSSISLFLHIVLNIRFSYALVLAAIGLSAASLYAVCRERFSPDWKSELPALAIVLGLAAVACGTLLLKETQLGEYALSFYAGSDQFGYAHLADWITGTPGSPGLESAKNPWDSWVYYMVTLDPRFGAISFVGTISIITGRPGIFSYNISCAIMLLCASAGLAGIFARNLLGFAALAVAIFFSSWLSVSEAGFLGKLIGYPSIFFTAGFLLLYLTKDRQAARVDKAALTIALTVCSALCYSGIGTAVLLSFIGGICLIHQFLLDRSVAGAIDKATMIVSVFVIAILASGTIARPMYSPSIILDVPWIDLWMEATQVIAPDGGLGWPSLEFGKLCAIFCALLCALVIWFSIRSESGLAVALSLGPIMLGVLLFAVGKKWEFQQAATVMLPGILCASAFLTRSENLRSAAPSWLIVAIALCGAGRAYQTVTRSVGSEENPRFLVTKSEIDEALSFARKGTILVDTSDVFASYPLVLEFHRNKIDHQFSQRGWKSMLGYRDWALPTYDKLPAVIVRLRSAPCNAARCGNYEYEVVGN